MSLHVEISEEAQEELRKQKQKTTATALAVATLTFTLVGLIFFLVAVVLPTQVETDIQAIAYENNPEPKHEVEELPSDTPTPTAPQVPSVITTNAVDAVPVPSIDTPVDSPVDFTPNTEIGEDFSPAESSVANNLPPSVVERCSAADRLSRLKKAGGDVAWEKNVEKGIAWLKSKQASNGAWGTADKTAMTGLALLAYFAHCETPYSEQYGESCLKGITYMIDIAKKNNGYLSENPKHKSIGYVHAISTYALSEAYLFCSKQGINVPNLKDTLDKAVDIILKSQCTDGSWMYYYAKSNKGKYEENPYPDLSVSGWNIQALKAAKLADIKVSECLQAITRSEKMLKTACDIKSGLFHYKVDNPTSGRSTMTAVAVLAFQMMGKAHLRECVAGSKHLIELVNDQYKQKQLEDNNNKQYTAIYNNPYLFYYMAQAVINMGDTDPVWKKYGKTLGTELAKTQKPSGEWPSAQSRTWWARSNEDNIIYGTTTSILSLEVFYRFLPSAGDGAKSISH